MKARLIQIKYDDRRYQINREIRRMVLQVDTRILKVTSEIRRIVVGAVA